MAYVVIEEFCDMQDGGRSYAKGDKFPRFIGIADEARLKELASSNNKLGRPLIKAIETPNTLETSLKKEYVSPKIEEETPVQRRKKSNK